MSIRHLHNAFTHINHCNVVNLTCSSLSLNTATSCSILVSVSLIFSSCAFASSRIRPFSKFKSNLKLAKVLCTSSLNRAFSLAISFDNRSCDVRVSDDSVESAVRSSERSLAKSTFCVYVAFSWSSRRTMVRVRLRILLISPEASVKNLRQNG